MNKSAKVVLVRRTALLLAKQLARCVVNKMGLGAGRTNDRRVTVFCILWRIRQPMLHSHPGLGTFV
jgi:hypothetical protein